MRAVVVLLLAAVLTHDVVRVSAGNILDPEVVASCARRWRTACIPYAIEPNPAWESDGGGTAVETIHDLMGYVSSRLADAGSSSRLVKVEWEDRGRYTRLIGIHHAGSESCRAKLGRVTGITSVHVAIDKCGRKGVVHEVMHALGVAHEHQRDDRDEYVRENEAVYSTISGSELEQWAKIKDTDLPSCRGYGEYHYTSIMHYDNEYNGEAVFSSVAGGGGSTTWGSNTWEIDDQDVAALVEVLRPCSFTLYFDNEATCNAPTVVSVGAVVAAGSAFTAAGAAVAFVKTRERRAKAEREKLRRRAGSASRSDSVDAADAAVVAKASVATGGDGIDYSKTDEAAYAAIPMATGGDGIDYTKTDEASYAAGPVAAIADNAELFQARDTVDNYAGRRAVPDTDGSEPGSSTPGAVILSAIGLGRKSPNKRRASSNGSRRSKSRRSTSGSHGVARSAGSRNAGLRRASGTSGSGNKRRSLSRGSRGSVASSAGSRRHGKSKRALSTASGGSRASARSRGASRSRVYDV